jgi:hypothetical protein
MCEVTYGCPSERTSGWTEKSQHGLKGSTGTLQTQMIDGGTSARTHWVRVNPNPNPIDIPNFSKQPNYFESDGRLIDFKSLRRSASLITEFTEPTFVNNQCHDKKY